jgi:hypothetical protein
MSYNFVPEGGGEPWGACCKSCRLPIFPDQDSEEVRFPEGTESAQMSGPYHAECAQPFASIARALDMLNRPWF